MAKRLCTLCLLLLCLTGCGAQPTAPAASRSTAISSAEPATSAPPSGNAAPSYLSDWLVTSSLGTSAVYALSEEEIADFIGCRVTYQSDKMYFNGNEISLSGYEETRETAEQFSEDFRIEPNALGLTDDSLTAVSVDAEGNFFGGCFFPKSEDTLVIYHEGVFFEATRN